VTIRNIIVLLMLTFVLAGCATKWELPKPLAKGSRIAVISNFRDQGLFQRAGTTTVDNASFYRRVPGLGMNSLITNTVTKDLQNSKKFRVIPIYHRPNNDMLNIAVTKGDNVTPQFVRYLSRLVAGKRIDNIVLIVPDSIDFGDGQYFGSIWWAAGYGLFNRAFVFIQTNIIFAAYTVYVIDAHTNQVEAFAHANIQKRTHGINVAWGRGYAGVAPSTLKSINTIIRKEMPAHLIESLHKTGLP